MLDQALEALVVLKKGLVLGLEGLLVLLELVDGLGLLPDDLFEGAWLSLRGGLGIAVIFMPAAWWRCGPSPGVRHRSCRKIFVRVKLLGAIALPTLAKALGKF